MKRCYVCKQELPPEVFVRSARSPDGLARICRPCKRETQAARIAQGAEWRAVISEKRCATCGEIKPAAEFHRNKWSKDGLKPSCKPCYCAEVKRGRIAGREDDNARRRLRRQLNPDHVRAQERASKERNRDKVLARKLAYAAANRERERQRAREWYATHLDYARERNLAYQKRFPEKQWARNATRRARVRNAPVVEKVDRAAIIARDHSICGICGQLVQPKDIHLDHIVPLSQGGVHTAANLRVTHRLCNLSRKRSGYAAQVPLPLPA